MTKQRNKKPTRGWAAILKENPNLAKIAVAMGMATVAKKFPAVQAAIDTAKEQEEVHTKRLAMQDAMQEALVQEVDARQEQELLACCPKSYSWREWRKLQEPNEHRRASAWQKFKTAAHHAGEKSGYFCNVSDKPNKIFGA